MQKKRAVSFVLCLALILAQLGGITAVYGSTPETGYKPESDPLYPTGIKSVTQITYREPDANNGSFVFDGVLADGCEGDDSEVVTVMVWDAAGENILGGSECSGDPIPNGETTYNTWSNPGGKEFFVTGGYVAWMGFTGNGVTPSTSDNDFENDGKKFFQIYFYFDAATKTVTCDYDNLLADPSPAFAVAATSPASVTKTVGEAVAFEVGESTLVSGGTSITATTPDALSYQWLFKKNGTTEFKELTGSTSTQYAIGSAKAADAGEYKCRVTYQEPGYKGISTEGAVGVLTVNKADQAALTLQIAPNPTTYGAVGVDLPKLSYTGGTVTGNAISYVSADPSVAAVNGGTVTILKAGATTITAISAGNDDYNSTSSAGVLLTVGKAEQTITTANAAGMKLSFNAAPATLDLEQFISGRQENAALHFSIASTTAGISGSISGSTLDIMGTATKGSIVIDAYAAETDNYLQSDAVSFTVEVIEGEATEVQTAPAAQAVTYAPGLTLGGVTLNAAGAKVTASDHVTVVAGTWDWLAGQKNDALTAGTVTKTAVFTPGDNGGVIYAPVTADVRVTVEKAAQDKPLIAVTPDTIKLGAVSVAPTTTNGAVNDGGLEFRLAPGSEAFGQITTSTGIVTGTAVGDARVQARHMETANYKASDWSEAAVLHVCTVPAITKITAAGDGKLDVTITANANNGEITLYHVTVSGIEKGTPYKEYTIHYSTGGGITTGTAVLTTTSGIVTDASGTAIFTTGGAAYQVDRQEERTVTPTSSAVYATSGALANMSFPNLQNGVEYTIEATAANMAGTSPVFTQKATPAVPSKPSGGSGHGGGGGGGGSVETTKYTVTYDAGDHGTIAEKTEQVEKDKSPKGVKVTADEGWAFVGWSKDGKTVIDLKDIKVTGSLKLIAVYEKSDKVVIPEEMPSDLRFLQKSQNEISGGYISGYETASGKEFRPDNPISRAEVAAILSQVINYRKEDGKSYANTPFGDVNQSDWYADDLGFLASLGITAGYKDGTYRPGSNITRAEFVTMVMKINGLDEKASSTFSDVSGSDWYAEYVKSAAAGGFVGGYTDGTFRPNNPITRAEAVTIINALLGLEPGQGELLFTDVAESHWAADQIRTASNK
ncbi:S-layer homology domain-containing protein [Bacilliculturomica massiliensis]|uniref:S-layer homology domain-containing protein n=1 Tax=Bacilliculturomica massiliensis TaxID=1917867 RepID=UPI00102F4808|nr:S-layer homology domain-containing protein [Bacilliculturomica massiliensis]